MFGTSSLSTAPRHDRRPLSATAGTVARARPVTSIDPLWVVCGAVTADTLAIAAATVAARILSGDEANWHLGAMAGAAFAMLHLGLGLARGDYAAERLLGRPKPLQGVLATFCLAATAALLLAFLTKTTAVYSRAATALLFGLGLMLLAVTRVALVRASHRWAAEGRLVLSRVMLVGLQDETSAFYDTCRHARLGLRLVAAAVLRPERDSFSDDLALAVATARMHRPDAIYLTLPWGDEAAISQAVDALRLLPASIHLGPPPLVQRFDTLGIAWDGPIASLRLVRTPLSPVERRMKRVFDATVAAVALFALSPLFLAIATAIRLDSPGPVFFRQRRTGFNQQPFRIYKFRSMTTMEDSATLTQVTAADARVTRLGRFLRRSSLDELPQLINVLRGEMSLIGPRPHALAHDSQFERAHAVYRRRHNMRPGITGWAQISGFRGETDTPDKVAGRLRHDLDYIDNWSLWLDLRILMLTLVSPRTFQNAK